MVKNKDNKDNQEEKYLREGKEQTNKKEDVSVLKKKIEYLEEELVRKDKEMQKLKQENIILFKTALKHSERKVDNKLIEEKKS
jgi:hypothetical protein